MRNASCKRVTGETDISMELNLDGTGCAAVATGHAFFDHMLDLLARHSLMDLTLQARGDLEVDAHHTVEDVGIVLGECIKNALGDKKGIARYGCSYLPMDETLTRVVMDLSNRPYVVFRIPEGGLPDAPQLSADPVRGILPRPGQQPALQPACGSALRQGRPPYCGIRLQGHRPCAAAGRGH